MRGKIFHFDHERIPEPVVHARSYGAHGIFECTKVIPDLARDVREFAVKFYTDQGNWDLVDNNMPVFFIQDAIKFPDLIYTAKAEPDTCFPQVQIAHTNFWDFISLVPESMHMVEITTGNFPTWTLAVQTFDQDFADSFDFTDDPLSQGRNFSYRDSQLKRLGSPNFTKISVNQPKGYSMHNYQQDGHMPSADRAGRINYEPNGWGEGPRKHPLEGCVSFRQAIEVEQHRIRDALIFELSEGEMLAVRRRMVSHPLSIDADLPKGVADALGIDVLPKPAPATQKTRSDLKPSPALSIVNNAPSSFAGRTVGLLAGDGADAGLVAAKSENVPVKIIAPKIGGFAYSQGTNRTADEKVDGGPSVLFDAIAIIPGEVSADALAKMAPALDFLKDAFGHCKCIALAPMAKPLHAACNLTEKIGKGCISLAEKNAAKDFLNRCAKLRFWDRVANL